MAYNGSIDFIPNTNLMVPGSTDLKFSYNRKALFVRVRQFKDYRREQEGKKYTIFDGIRKMGSLWFNIAESIKFRHYVIVRIRDDTKEDP